MRFGKPAIVFGTGVALGVMLSGNTLRAQEAGNAPERHIESAGSFRNITSTGVTKPPGRAAGDVDETKPGSLSKQRATDRKIESGVCIGCN